MLLVVEDDDDEFVVFAFASCWSRTKRLLARLFNIIFSSSTKTTRNIQITNNTFELLLFYFLYKNHIKIKIKANV